MCLILSVKLSHKFTTISAEGQSRYVNESSFKNLKLLKFKSLNLQYDYNLSTILNLNGSLSDDKSKTEAIRICQIQDFKDDFLCRVNPSPK